MSIKLLLLVYISLHNGISRIINGLHIDMDPRSIEAELNNALVCAWISRWNWLKWSKLTRLAWYL